MNRFNLNTIKKEIRIQFGWVVKSVKVRSNNGLIKVWDVIIVSKANNQLKRTIMNKWESDWKKNVRNGIILEKI